MTKTEITILINQKSDIGIVQSNVIDAKIQSPIYIFEYENHYQLRFESDYEEWELDTKILNFFSDYEFTTDLEKGRKEIRIQISRYQSELSTDGWGRRIENPLNETKYLIKKSTTKTEKINPNIKILFEGKEQNYYINIVNGINKITGEKGFLLVNNFKSKHDNDDNADILEDSLYKSHVEAFQFGYYKMQHLVNQDFDEYIEIHKKALRDLHKIPRKTIRDFINCCNNSDNEGIFKNLDENMIFEKRIGGQTKERIKDIEQFKEYLCSPNQELCAKKIKIRSTWNINLPIVTIDIKYFSDSIDNNIQRYNQITFELKNNKIFRITEGK